MSEGLYDIGLWPARTLPEIQEAVSKSLPHDGVVCREGENGWDYVCDTCRRGHRCRSFAANSGLRAVRCSQCAT